MASYIHGQIEIKAFCLIRHDRKILVSKGYDKTKKETFYRFLGGTVEFGETGEQAVVREIKEELGSGLLEVVRLDLIQNIFSYNNEDRHQLTFLFEGTLSDKTLHEKDSIQIMDAPESQAVWLPIEEVLNGKAILYPTYDYLKILGEAP